MASPVIHFEIHGSDSKRQTDFYSGVFGWNVNADNPQIYAMDEKEGDLGISGGLAQSEMAPAVLVYVGADDLQATLDKVGNVGGKTVMPVAEIEGVGVTIAIFEDPAGNKVGLVKT